MYHILYMDTTPGLAAIRKLSLSIKTRPRLVTSLEVWWEVYCFFVAQWVDITCDYSNVVVVIVRSLNSVIPQVAISAVYAQQLPIFSQRVGSMKQFIVYRAVMLSMLFLADDTVTELVGCATIVPCLAS